MLIIKLLCLCYCTTLIMLIAFQTKEVLVSWYQFFGICIFISDYTSGFQTRSLLPQCFWSVSPFAQTRGTTECAWLNHTQVPHNWRLLNLCFLFVFKNDFIYSWFLFTWNTCKQLVALCIQVLTANKIPLLCDCSVWRSAVQGNFLQALNWSGCIYRV